MALWNGSKDPILAGFDVEGDDDSAFAQESAGEILNKVTPEKGRVFAWLEQGADEILGVL